MEVISLAELLAVSISNTGHWEREMAVLWEQQRMKQMHREKQDQEK